jgi:hypothetical protein
MRGQTPGRIETPRLFQKSNARNALAHKQITLGRRQITGDPLKTGSVVEALAQIIALQGPA